MTPAEIDSATTTGEGMTTCYDIPTLTTTTQLWEALLTAASADGGLRLLGASRAVLGFTVAEGARLFVRPAAAHLRERFARGAHQEQTLRLSRIQWIDSLNSMPA
jgi:hypothetical protein